MIDKVAGRSLRSGFLASAALDPNATALVVRGVARTYGEIETTARILGECHGAGPKPAPG